MSKKETVKKEEIKSSTAEVGDDYFFPDYQITIKAKSLQEALEKLEAMKPKK